MNKQGAHTKTHSCDADETGKSDFDAPARNLGKLHAGRQKALAKQGNTK